MLAGKRLFGGFADRSVPGVWAGLADVLDGSRCVLVLGGSDTGKTTLVRYLAHQWVERGLRVGLICADPGQPLIGLPTTFSLTVLSGTGDGAVLPGRVAFVGETSPVGCTAEVLSALARLLEEARRTAPDRVVVDTCGLITWQDGVSLKRREVDLCAPVEVLAIQRGKDLEPILSSFLNRDDVCIRRMRPAPAVGKKAPVRRREIRQGHFTAYFSGGHRRTLFWRAVPIRDLPVGRGTPLRPEALARLSEGVDVSLEGVEVCGECAAVLTRGRVGTGALCCLKERLPAEVIAHVACEDLKGRVSAFLDAGAWVVGLGILERVMPDRQRMDFWTPIDEGQNVAAVQLGGLVLDPAGCELGHRRQVPVAYI